MKVLVAVIVALVLIVGVNSLPKATSTGELINGIPRSKLGMYQTGILISIAKYKMDP
jgi:hypothetical protein